MDLTSAPLCVDLDGTLCRTDTLIESCLRWVLKRPTNVFLILAALVKGRACLKERLAQENLPNIALLPYNHALIDWLRTEKSSGRKLVLATAANAAIAEEVARHVGCFDMVIASNATRNLKGSAKVDELNKRFSASGFDYVGDSTADIPVWAQARRAYAVNPQKHVLRAVPKLATVNVKRLSLFRSLLRACRPHQWAKNILLFVPLIAAHRIFDFRTDLAVAVSFIAFCLVASSVYLTNDIVDLENDRAHPKKKHRPIANGDLPIGKALGASIALLAGGLALSASVSPGFFLCLFAYYGITFAYSHYLKRKLIVDVICLALLYSARVLAGGITAHIVLSHWLLAFSMFLFTSLAFVKRYTEINAMGKSMAGNSGRAYCPTDLLIIAMLGVSSGILSTLILVLYVSSPEVQALYRSPQLLLIACPILLYWFARLWILTGRNDVHHDPIVFALRDARSYVVALLLAAVLVFATVF